MHLAVHTVWTDDGVRLALTEVTAAEGSPNRGPAFLLVPGFAQNRRAFLEGTMASDLVALGARVYVGELRGHGLSRGPNPPPRWTIDGHVRHDLPALAAAVLRRTGESRLHYVGHSLGGMLALAWIPSGPPFASLTTYATPLVIGTDRPVVRPTAWLARSVNSLRPWRQVPMTTFLGALSDTLSAEKPDPVRGWFQRYTGLSNPGHAHSHALRTIFSTADPESPAVFGTLLAMAARGDARLGSYDLAAIARTVPMPWIAVHGSRDIFAPPSSVAALRAGHHAGPRWVIEVPGATHVDVAIGHHLREWVPRWWKLLFRG